MTASLSFSSIKPSLACKHLVPVKDKDYKDRYFVLDQTDGSASVADAVDTFRGGIDPTIGNYYGEKWHPAPPTPKTIVIPYEVSREKELRMIVKSLAVPLKKLVITEHQLVVLVRDHEESLQLDEFAVFTIVEIDGEYYLFQVRNFVTGSPRVSVGDYHMQKPQCEDRYKMCLVLPQVYL